MDASHSNNSIRTGVAALVVVVVMITANDVFAGTIQLRKQATVRDRDVRIRDIATLTRDLPAFYGALVVGRFDHKSNTLDVTDQAIRRALTARGENAVLVNFSGFEVCRVQYQPRATIDGNPKNDATTTKPIRSVDATTAPVLSNPAEEVGLDARLTVRQRIADWLVDQLKVRRDDLHVEFDERDAATLDVPAWRDRFAFTTGTRGFLGRLSVTITRIRDEKLVDTKRVTVHVAKRQLAAVATRDLRRGDVIRSGDLEIREVKLTRDQGLLVGKISDVIGQVVKGSLREGHVVSMDDVEPPLFVRRNEIVQVKVVSGGLLVQTFGRALDDGALGEFVRVRNETSKETYFARVIGSRQATLEVKAPNAGKTGRKTAKRN